jgi:AcrR family transcriptional regulator
MALPARRTDLSPVKRRQILAGARLAFGELGYQRTSVDVVAARAGVGKATVYNHFEDKQALFLACFSEEADALREELRRSLGEAGGDPSVALRRVGEQVLRLRTLISPPFLSLYRHTVAETERFPELGEAFFERGPAVVYQAVAAWLRRWEALGALELDDAHAAAVQFVGLCQGDLVLRARLGLRPQPTRAQVRARSAVRSSLPAGLGPSGGPPRGLPQDRRDRVQLPAAGHPGSRRRGAGSPGEGAVEQVRAGGVLTGADGRQWPDALPPPSGAGAGRVAAPPPPPRRWVLP